MPLARSVRRTLRGPVRDRWRLQQSRTPMLSGRRVGGPPDFVGIGVQRCGTSWWHGLIEAHPGVAPLGFGAKELHFFDDWWSGDFGPAQVDRYHAHFLRARGEHVGEWTPRYLYDPWAVPLLLQAAPEAKLLVLLRDPVARFRSGLKHARKLSDDAGRGIDADAVDAALDRGRYATQLAPLLRLVPREQVLVLQFERCVQETRRMLDVTFDFLGLPGAPVPIVGAVNASSAGDGSSPLSGVLVELVRERYRQEVDRLVDLFPGAVDPQLWRETCG